MLIIDELKKECPMLNNNWAFFSYKKNDRSKELSRDLLRKGHKQSIKIRGGRGMRKAAVIFLLILSVSLFYSCAGLETRKASEPVQTEYMVKSPAGPTIYVVRKAPSQMKPTKVVLLIPWVKSGSTVYNLPVEGYNLMDYLVSKGFVAYSVDHRSYGKSTKTDGLDVSADNCGQDMKAVADFIQATENVEKINVVGLSFGTTISLSLAAHYPEEVERMVLMGLPYKKVNEKVKKSVYNLAHMAETGKTFIPSNPVSAKGLWYKYDENVLNKFVEIVEERTPVAPTGPFIDARDGRHAKYVPIIQCPVLFMLGEYEVFVDLDDAMDSFKDCTSEKKAYMLIGNASHGLVLEKAHDLVFRTIYGWLSD
jgi:pimeloyl-ACP methyl ester carboxylesterase